MVAVKNLRPAPAIFIGIQDGFGVIPAIELYALTAPVGMHPVRSSVSRRTLESHGYYVPPVGPKAVAQVGEK
jgi:hypothetical protein